MPQEEETEPKPPTALHNEDWEWIEAEDGEEKTSNEVWVLTILISVAYDIDS
jgi:hypothetical protein